MKCPKTFLRQKYILNAFMKLGPDETGMDSFFFLFFAYRSREYINETVLLLITDKSHQSIRDSLMNRNERGEDLNLACTQNY